MPPLQQLTFFHPRHQFQSRSRPIHFLSFFFFMFAYFLLSIGQIARPVHPAARPVHPAARPVRRGRRPGRPVTGPVDGRRSAVGGRRSAAGRPGGPEAGSTARSTGGRVDEWPGGDPFDAGGKEAQGRRRLPPPPAVLWHL